MRKVVAVARTDRECVSGLSARYSRASFSFASNQKQNQKRIRSNLR